MFDDLRAQAILQDPPLEFLNRVESKVEYCGVIFFPEYNPYTGGIKGYMARLKNLRVTIRYSLEGVVLRIDNSIHKFYWNNNYCLMTYEELCQALDEVLSIFQLSEAEVEVKNFEFGLNLPISFSGNEIMQNFQGYKSHRFQDLKWKSKMYGRKVYLHEYDFKIYDKTVEQKYNARIVLSSHILRIELKLKHKRKRKVRYVKDMKNIDKMLELYVLLINCYRDIIKRPLYNLGVLKPQERMLLFAGENPEYWQVERSFSVHYKKELRAKYLKIIKQSNNEDLYNQIEDIMIDQIYKTLEKVLPLYLYNIREKGGNI